MNVVSFSPDFGVVKLVSFVLPHMDINTIYTSPVLSIQANNHCPQIPRWKSICMSRHIARKQYPQWVIYDSQLTPSLRGNIVSGSIPPGWDWWARFTRGLKSVRRKVHTLAAISIELSWFLFPALRWTLPVAAAASARLTCICTWASC
jgi:hypothetical protein